MEMDVVRVSVDLKTGRTINKKKIGKKNLDDNLLATHGLMMLTGLTMEEFYQQMKRDVYGT